MARLGDEARPVFLAAAELFLLALLFLAETNRLQLKILEIFIVILNRSNSHRRWRQNISPGRKPGDRGPTNDLALEEGDRFLSPLPGLCFNNRN